MLRTEVFAPLLFCLMIGLCGAIAAATAEATSGLESINDDDLVHLIKEEDFVIVLFAKNNCDECDSLETHLFNLRKDLKENIGAHAVKAHNSQLARLYSPTKEPAIVFFRHGVPLLYEGTSTEDDIYTRFDENKTPVTRELADENFEHLTQASSGATTGDWFILFYNRECIDCQRLTAVWEAVGAATKNRLNVARIDKDTSGLTTAKRFNVQKAPEFIFIRQGNYYRYEIPKYDVKSFVSFATEWFKNARAEKVTVAPSPFDELVASAVRLLKNLDTAALTNILQNQPIALAIASASGLLLIILLVKLCCCSGTKKPAASKDKESKSTNKLKKDK